MNTIHLHIILLKIYWGFLNINIICFFVNIDQKHIERYVHSMKLDIKYQEVFYHENINLRNVLWGMLVIIQEPIL
jgi:hypothetical protein